MSEFSEKMGMEVGNAFKSGYNCSEAIVEAFRKYAGVNIDDNAFRLARIWRRYWQMPGIFAAL